MRDASSRRQKNKIKYNSRGRGKNNPIREMQDSMKPSESHGWKPTARHRQRQAVKLSGSRPSVRPSLHPSICSYHHISCTLGCRGPAEVAPSRPVGNLEHSHKQASKQASNQPRAHTPARTCKPELPISPVCLCFSTCFINDISGDGHG